ncbi:MAG TPA: heterodisulfide reductase-related iron-sulfur binding cluster [Candidatus Deferrimicrobium sp.]|nr:heterodisulfide reductase-related iron-sulfur binding cluster [Candidatus Deferrimicrobium sp.]
MDEYLQMINRCIDCYTCNLACPIYNFTHKEVDSPNSRIHIAKRIFNKEKIVPDEFEAIYNCPKCEKCELTCPSDIKISKIVGKAREELFKQGYELVPGHQKLRDSIIQNRNSVKGDPAHLLDYLPDNFTYDESATTLFYAGCLPGYFLKDIATSSVQILKRIGTPFKILKDEICCGSPLMDLGDTETAKKFFKENLEIFEKNQVKELIVSCAGCYRCFKEFYSEVLGVNINVRHIIDIIAEALKEGRIQFKKIDKKVIYHDPCHLSREFGKYDSPRAILTEATESLVEFLTKRQAADCCGADSAVRAGFTDLSVQIALKRVDTAIDRADILTTSCPFCTFNLNYARKKNNRDLDIQYITNFLLNAIKD